MKRWDVVDDARLLRMVATGTPWLEIARIFGVTVAACDARWRKIRTRPEQTERKAARAYQERRYRDFKPHHNPSEPDSSSVKFANCAEHLQNIARANNGMGFPVLPIARFRRPA